MNEKKIFYPLIIYLGFFICFLFFIGCLVYVIDKLDQFYYGEQAIDLSNQTSQPQPAQEVKQYISKGKLLVVDEIKKPEGQLEIYQNDILSFQYPAGWVVTSIFESGTPAKNTFDYAFRKSSEKPDAFFMHVYNNNDFISNYTRCFLFSPCSKDYLQEDLDKILTGQYINFFNSGPYPPGGVSTTVISRVVGNKVASIGFNTEVVDSGFTDFDELFSQLIYLLKTIQVK